MSIHSRERWHGMSIAEQMGNIGSEYARCVSNPESRQAMGRLDDLFDLTLSDRRLTDRYSEIARLREVAIGSLQSQNHEERKFLTSYFLQFGMLACKNRDRL